MPIKGQEASQMGSLFTLRPRDWMVPSFQETAAMVWRGWPIDKLLRLYAGHIEGGSPAPRQHDLPLMIKIRTPRPQAPTGTTSGASPTPRRAHGWLGSRLPSRPDLRRATSR